MKRVSEIMIRKNTGFLLSAAIMLLLTSACSNTPARRSGEMTSPFRALYDLMIREKVTDARYQQVVGHDYFLINLPLRNQLQQYGDLRDLVSKKDFVIDILQTSVKLGEEAMSLYLSRISPGQLEQFAIGHPDLFGDASKLSEAYRQYALQAEMAEVKRVRNTGTVAALDRYWKSFTGNIEESIMTKGRLQRELETFYAVPFIKGWIAYHEATDYRGAVKPDFNHYEVYIPSLDVNKPENISADNWALLRHFAPVVVHEINQNAPYSIENDRFGEVYLTGKTLADVTPQVDTTKPTLYAYVDQKTIQGVNVKQLVYTLWQPSHPQLSRLDPEAGPFDGWSIRVSLDENNQPLDFESVSNCGCYYKNFPTDRLELLASNVFQEKHKDKRFYIENVVKGKFDAIVPELVTDIDANQANDIVIYFSAGRHQLITIRSKQHAELLDQTSEPYRYQLRHYDELENLPFADHRASLFGTDGLVRKAHRPECKLLKPSGLYHAGHPRQRETQMIYFDEAKFDDPNLLSTYLRLPPNAFGLKND